MGAPVLFIPGQAGSYKQVRSLASESSKYSRTQKNVQDLDWFTRKGVFVIYVDSLLLTLGSYE